MALKKFKKTVIVIIILGCFVMSLFTLIPDLILGIKVRRNYLANEISDLVVKIRKSEKGTIIIYTENDTTYLIGCTTCFENIIELGDSVYKPKNSYNVMLFKLDTLDNEYVFIKDHDSCYGKERFFLEKLFLTGKV